MDIEVIQTKNALSPTQMSLAPFAINPYRGCEFGCSYCYGRLTKNMKYNQHTLGIKTNLPQILEKELQYKQVDKVLLGSSCECFTYRELQSGLTEQILTILNDHNVSYTILTKAPLIQRYLHLITHSRNNKIFFTFNFSQEKIKRLLENASPSLTSRLRALKNIQRAGIARRLHIGPYIPYFSHIQEIFSLVKGLIEEVDVELYHKKMGNFPEVLRRLRHYDPRGAAKLEEVYRNKENYYNFSQNLKRSLISLNRDYKFKLYFIVPEFGRFYDSTINYEDTLV
jgi:DNA repair photolyase